ncbi:E3 ubiquitin-protein ligase synoviolin A [Nymphon striatum]|nr:E3 ubiquitin-protein ligase synoviolin A [Nymphon striatum]
MITAMRTTILTCFSVAMTISVVSYAFLQKRQFYPTVVYLTKSNPSMAVIYLQAFILVILTSKLMRKIFFGQLRAAEQEHLIERAWYAITETCLAFTVFRDDFSPKFVALFTILLVLKSFHWLIEDRVDFVTLMFLLGLLDYCFVYHAYLSTLNKGATVQLVFGFEYAVLLTILVNIFIKYILHTIDLQSETPWENKAVYLLYSELVVGLVKVLLYIVFLGLMIKIHTFPLFTIRPMYMAMRTLRKAFNDVVLSRQAIRNMNTLYPDATAEDLAATDNVCIICREEMITGTSKKLPCNHIFHTSCLRSWFQRQQTCPTCRMNILRTVQPPPSNAAAPPQAQQPQQNAAQQFPMPNIGLFIGGAQFPGPIWPQQQAAQNPDARPPSSTSDPSSTTVSSQTTTSAATSSGMIPPIPPFLPPPFFPVMFPPPPMPPVDFSGFSDEEIRQMEGNERENVEARIQSLRNIQILLDAAVLQMQQYSALVSSIRQRQPAPFSSQNTSTTNSVHTVMSTTAGSSSGTSPSSSSNIPSADEPDANTGARPKVFCPAPKPFTTNMSSAPSSPAVPVTSSTTQLSEESNEGAVGFSVPSTSEFAHTEETKDQAICNDHDEVRRRRLEHFSTQSLTDKKDNLDLD